MAQFFCISIDWGSTLNAIDLWQLLISSVGSVIGMYNNQQLLKKECTYLFENYSGR